MVTWECVNEICILGHIWVWIQGLMLARQVIYHLSHIPALTFFRWGFAFDWGQIVCTSSYIIGITDVYHNSWFIGWDEVFLTFYLSWLQTTILQLFTSRVTVTVRATTPSLNFFLRQWLMEGSNSQIKNSRHSDSNRKPEGLECG
jgi:hypothetical protein